MLRSNLKSWFMTLAFMSVSIILLLYVYSLQMGGWKRSGSVQEENGNRRPMTKERLESFTNPSANLSKEMLNYNEMLTVLNKWLPKLTENIKGLQHHVENPPDDMQQQQQQQKQPEKTSIEEFNKRRRRINYVCSTGQVSGSVNSIMTHKTAGVIYCIVPKAGCTFWKSVFKAVNSQSNNTEEIIESMTRETIHNRNSPPIRFNSTEYTTTEYPTRLIVARDPYSRLLSAYLDKIYLPDFWKSEVVIMAEKLQGNSSSVRNTDFLRNHFNEMANIFENKANGSRTTTEVGNKCGKYMTFSEFAELGFTKPEPHWMPIHKVCNPCSFQATHISTMETFTADARVVLSQMKLENIIDNLDEQTQIDEEINIISYYNFHHFYKNKTLPFYKPCLSPKEIAYRLWHNFQWRGYIDPDLNYQIPELTDLQDIEGDFMAQVTAARKSGLQNPKKMKDAKKEFKKKAFLSISKAMFEKLSQKYALDFELFGYTDLRDEMYTYYNSQERSSPNAVRNAALTSA